MVIYFVDVCDPIIPFRKRFTSKEVQHFLVKKCHRLISLEPKFEGTRLRVNPLTQKGILIDYIGCCIYDNIIRIESQLSSIGQGELDQREYQKIVRRFLLLKGIFSSSYRDAYSVLVD